MAANTSLSIGLMAATVLGCSLIVALVRSPFLIIGVLLLFVGAECLTVEKMVLRIQDHAAVAQPQGMRRMFSSSYTTPPPPRSVDPPLWAGYALISMGSVAIFYSAAMGNKKKSGA